MMADQAAKLREMIVSKTSETSWDRGERRIIAVSSGKGGVGKTSLVVNLAIALSRAGQKVMIMDADLGMANVDIMMGLTPRCSLYDVLQGRKSLQDIVITGAEGVKVIPGCAGIFDMANIGRMQKESLVHELEAYTEQLDFILVDTGAGISPVVLGSIAAADEVVVVITPEPTSISDGYGIIKVLAKFKLHRNVHLVVNMAASLDEAQGSAGKIETVVDKYLDIDVNRLGFIYSDHTVRRSVQEMQPFMIRYPRSQVARDITQLAGSIMGHRAGPNQAGPGFARKLMGLLR